MKHPYAVMLDPAGELTAVYEPFLSVAAAQAAGWSLLSAWRTFPATVAEVVRLTAADDWWAAVWPSRAGGDSE